MAGGSALQAFLLQSERDELVRQAQIAKETLAAIKAAEEKPKGPTEVAFKLILPEDTPGGTSSLVGLIIGPRGKTQQWLEAETACKIVIRGKNSSKRIQTFGPEKPDDEEPTYVLIRGPSDEAIALAKKKV